MQENNIRHRTMQTDHTKFGGIVYLSDFSTYPRRKTCVAGSPTAGRIAQDQRFDAECRKIAEKRIDARQMPLHP